MVGYSEYFNRLYFQSTYVEVGFSGWLRVGYSEYFEQLYFQSTYEYNLTLPFTMSCYECGKAGYTSPIYTFKKINFGR